MDRAPTEVEELFGKLSAFASEAGYNLDAAKLTLRPGLGNPRGPFVQLHVRSWDEMERLPSPAAVENFFGG